MKNIDKINQLQTEMAEMQTKITNLELLVKFYEEQFKLSKSRQFGKSSEKTENPEQLSFFDEVENTADKKEPEPTLENITYARKKRVGKREEDLSKLPVETVLYELPENEQVCSECGESLHVMSYETRRELKIIPAQVSVVEHKKAIYSCRACEKNNDHTPIITAASPDPVIKGSLASPSAVAHLMCQKYIMASPLYRLEHELKSQGISLSRQTMANWLIRCSEDWLEPIYERMKAKLLEHDVLHADETVLQVLQEPGKKANTNSYEWLYRTSGDDEHAIVLYEYQPTRSSSHPKHFLKGFKGYLHTDGYAGYHSLPDITVVGCWAHARRKFEEALKAIDADKRADSQAKKGEDYCNRLFGLEREFSKLSIEERYIKRLEQSLPLAEEFLSWAKSIQVLPKMLLGKAIGYLIEQWPYLKNFYLDGRLELSNNRAERSIKTFVIGRKNWLFCNSQKGAKASSVIYSIIETAKENGLKPFEYLKFIFETIPNTPISQIDHLLPSSENLPAFCKV